MVTHAWTDWATRDEKMTSTNVRISRARPLVRRGEYESRLWSWVAVDAIAMTDGDRIVKVASEMRPRLFLLRTLWFCNGHRPHS